MLVWLLWWAWTTCAVATMSDIELLPPHTYKKVDAGVDSDGALESSSYSASISHSLHRGDHSVFRLDLRQLCGDTAIDAPLPTSVLNACHVSRHTLFLRLRLSEEAFNPAEESLFRLSYKSWTSSATDAGDDTKHAEAPTLLEKAEKAAQENHNTLTAEQAEMLVKQQALIDKAQNKPQHGEKPGASLPPGSSSNADYLDDEVPVSTSARHGQMTLQVAPADLKSALYFVHVDIPHSFGSGLESHDLGEARFYIEATLLRAPVILQTHLPPTSTVQQKRLVVPRATGAFAGLLDLDMVKYVMYARNAIDLPPQTSDDAKSTNQNANITLTVVAQLPSEITTDRCERDAMPPRECFTELARDLVRVFPGSRYPSCLAEHWVADGSLPDCFALAGAIGFANAMSLNSTEAYLACLDHGCEDGCEQAVIVEHARKVVSRHFSGERNVLENHRFLKLVSLICFEFVRPAQQKHAQTRAVLQDAQNDCLYGVGRGLAQVALEESRKVKPTLGKILDACYATEHKLNHDGLNQHFSITNCEAGVFIQYVQSVIESQLVGGTDDNNEANSDGDTNSDAGGGAESAVFFDDPVALVYGACPPLLLSAFQAKHANGARRRHLQRNELEHCLTVFFDLVSQQVAYDMTAMSPICDAVRIVYTSDQVGEDVKKLVDAKTYEKLCRDTSRMRQSKVLAELKSDRQRCQLGHYKSTVQLGVGGKDGHETHGAIDIKWHDIAFRNETRFTTHMGWEAANRSSLRVPNGEHAEFTVFYLALDPMGSRLDFAFEMEDTIPGIVRADTHVVAAVSMVTVNEGSGDASTVPVFYLIVMPLATIILCVAFAYYRRRVQQRTVSERSFQIRKHRLQFH